MNKLLILLALITLSGSGCKSIQQARAKNKKEWLVKKGYLVADTLFVPGDTISGETSFIVDTLEVEKQIDSIRDTCITKRRVKDLIKKIPIKIDPVHVDSSRYTLDIWSDGGGTLKYKVVIKPVRSTGLKEASPCPPEAPWYNTFIIGALSMTILFLILLIIFKK